MTAIASVSDVERVAIRRDEHLASEDLGGLGARLCHRHTLTLADMHQRERLDATRRRLLPRLVRRHVLRHARILDVLAQEGALGNEQSRPTPKLRQRGIWLRVTG